MSKLLSAIKRTFASPSGEPLVHFHRGASVDAPEVCYDRACTRPHLTP